MDITLTLCRDTTAAEHTADGSTAPAPKSEDANSILLIIPGEPVDASGANQLGRGLAAKFKTYVVCGALPQVDAVLEYVDALVAAVEKAGIKRATICGIGSGGSIAQALAVRAPKMVRRVVLVDATTRVAPGTLTRLIDRVERFLPLGLPMRSLSKEFDSRPVLHRIHCPTLVAASPDTRRFLHEQARVLARRIPNSWLTSLTAPALEQGALSSELSEHIAQFLQVPVKRPQKSL